MGELTEKVKGKKVYLWGAGQVCRLFLNSLGKGLDIQGIIDDNPRMCGKQFCGINVIPSPILGKDICTLENKQIRRDDIVFVLMFNFYRKKRKELDALGYVNFIPPEMYTGGETERFLMTKNVFHAPACIRKRYAKCCSA